MWEKILQPPVNIAQGKVMTSLGSGNKQNGVYQIERFTSEEPVDSLDSKAVVQWGPKTTGLGGFLGIGRTWDARNLSVDDTDSEKNLRVNLGKNADGRAELSVINESGARRTELRFPLGLVTQLYADEVASLTSLRAGHVAASHQESGARQNTSITVGEQTFLLADGHLKKA